MEEMKHETDTRRPRILDLSLRYKWYDMIASGEKTEEYREIKDFYMNRLCKNYISGFSGFYFTPKEYDAVRFHRGQGSKQTMLLEFKGLTKGFGNPEWGAPEDKEVFIIKLGKRLDITEPVVLGWTRDEKGKIVDRHPVEVANAVTAAKRDNTQNYVITPINNQDGCSRTIKRQYQQTSRANLERQDALGATGATDGFRIRKLTPRECFRLMGVSDADIDKIQAAGISKSQQYKMAGNSIVVNCLAAIFRQLFIGNFNKVVQTEIF